MHEGDDDENYDEDNVMILIMLAMLLVKTSAYLNKCIFAHDR